MKTGYWKKINDDLVEYVQYGHEPIRYDWVHINIAIHNVQMRRHEYASFCAWQDALDNLRRGRSAFGRQDTQE